MLRKHPKGLYYLFVIEMWERLGFAIMSAVYVLYMDKVLLLDDVRKGVLYGAFFGASYLFPLLGGWLGDQVFGQTRTLTAGVVMMAAGYVGLALSGVDSLAPFYAGLSLIAMGTGIFKVNMSSLVGNVYRDSPELKDAGFNIYYMGVNLGFTMGPLIATFVGAYWNDYRITFWIASAGMLGALACIALGRKTLKLSDSLHQAKVMQDTSEVVMSPGEFKDRIVTLIVLFLIATFFWIPFYQNGMALTLFAERSTVAYKFLRPETYQVFNAIFIVILTPPMLAMFGWLNRRRREPSTPVKIFWGLMIMGAAMGVMAIASLVGGNEDAPRMSPLWLIMTYLLITLGEILISPMGQSYVSKVAPAKIQGLMMGGWFAATAVGAMSAGLFGSFYAKMDHHWYFVMLAGISVFAACLILLCIKKLNKYAA
jgi:POT family proton-dependent oligopeptide transporter